MTRFARARGSKSSNERAPDDGTPWEVMKEQMLQAKTEGQDAKNRKEAEKQRIENYEKFLKEHKVQKRQATWCDFPEDERKQNKNSSITQSEEQPFKKKKKIKQNSKSELVQPEVKTNEISESNITKIINAETVSPAKRSKKKNKQKDQTPIVSKPHSIEINSSQISEQNPSKKKKKKNKKGKLTDSTVTQSEDNSQMEIAHITVNQDEENDMVPNEQNKRLKKNKNKLVKSTFSPTSNTDTGNIDKVNETTSVAKTQKSKKKKNKNLVNGQTIRRKEINDNSFQLIINGKDVELVRFDGFPIMKKDAERLAELKSSMIKKGIPKSEVQRTMKLERRRAEKALARLKRDVCYNCRKGGHNLSDCPELKSKIPGVDTADGVCFKCGSTEHRQFECKVQREKEFRFATCFICKEPGHIARQCPDNPKGLYPNGGGCKLCGDVTHLRKDCPTVKDKNEQTSVKLQTLDSSESIEDIRLETKTSAVDESAKKPKKIKF